MQVEVMGLIAAAFGLAALFLGTWLGIYALFTATLLGAAAAISLPALGGANVLPAHLLLGFLVLALLVRERALGLYLRALAPTRLTAAAFFLMLTAIYGFITAFFLPRIFAGETEVFALARGAIVGLTIKKELSPSSGNITQPAYLVGNFVCFVTVVVLARNPQRLVLATRAAILCALVNLVFALFDLVTYWTHTSHLMGVFRTASYRMLDQGAIFGLKRIVGSFSETAAYSYATLGLFAFTFQCWLRGLYRQTTLWVSMASLLTLALSTSATAYAGLGLYLGATYLDAAVRRHRGRGMRQARMFVVGGPMLMMAAIALVALAPQALDVLQAFFDHTLLSKLDSQSGLERSSWNEQALTNFLDTRGLGAGVGSVRASSFLVALLANLGIIGTLAYAAFLCLVTAGRPSRRELTEDDVSRSIRSAARSACVALLIAAAISGTTVDLGLPFFIFAGIASGGRMVSARRSTPLPVRRPHLAM